MNQALMDKEMFIPGTGSKEVIELELIDAHKGNNPKSSLFVTALTIVTASSSVVVATAIPWMKHGLLKASTTNDVGLVIALSPGSRPPIGHL